MKRNSEIVSAMALLLALCAVAAPSTSMAEPILGEEGFVAPSEEISDQKQETAEAMALFRARDFDGALKQWEAAAKKNPDLPPAQVIMAQLYLEVRMDKEARAALDRAIAEWPSDPEAYLVKASLAMGDQKPAEAESLLRKASELVTAFDKSDKRKKVLQAGVQNGMAVVAESRQDWPSAQKELEALLTIDPKNVMTMRRIARSLFQQKDVDGALAQLREASKIRPELPAPELTLAQFFGASGDRENADKWMAAALAAAPKDLKTRLAVGEAAMNAGRLDEAQKHAIAAVQLGPKSRQAKMFRGLIALFQKDYSAAESIFQAAVQQSPQDVTATNNLALALIAQQDETKAKRALELAEANAKRMPDTPEIASTYALVLYKLGRLDDAEKAIRVAAPLATSDIDTAYVIARLAVDRGHKDEAKKTLETVLKGTKPFMFRHDAEELLKELKK